MKLPDFEILSLTTVGVHLDPRKAKTKRSNKSHWVVDYELNFFSGDIEGHSILDSTTFPAKDGYFLCAKPGQTLQMLLPFRCYRLHLATRDPELKKALDSLPSFAHHPEMPRILELCKKACHVDQRSTLNAKFELYSYITTVLTLLLRQYPDAIVAAKEGNVRRHEQALLDANTYLQNHCDEDIDLKQLAKDSGLHPTYFQKLFTAAFGGSPNQKLAYYRVIRARNLLHDDNRPISEIARLCGFSYQSYFTRVFKQYTNQTPSRFRQSLRKRRTERPNL